MFDTLKKRFGTVGGSPDRSAVLLRWFERLCSSVLPSLFLHLHTVWKPYAGWRDTHDQWRCGYPAHSRELRWQHAHYCWRSTLLAAHRAHPVVQRNHSAPRASWWRCACIRRCPHPVAKRGAFACHKARVVTPYAWRKMNFTEVSSRYICGIAIIHFSPCCKHFLHVRHVEKQKMAQSWVKLKNLHIFLK